MTESEYMLVSALQRLRAASTLLADSVVFADSAVPGSQGSLNRMIFDIERIVGKLERMTGEAIEEDSDADG